MKRIGILGGISHESTIEYYARILRKYFERAGNTYYPEVVIYSLDLQKYTDFEDSGDLDGLVGYILQGVQALKAAGVDFALMSANSPHAVYDRVAPLAGLPMISIVECTAKAAHAAGVKKVLLLGIKFTMQGNFYPQRFAELGIEVITPSENEQDEINQVIFAELCHGNFAEPIRQRFLAIIDRYREAAQIEGVILGCTELPLLLKSGDRDIPFFDTVELHTEAALSTAMGA